MDNSIEDVIPSGNQNVELALMLAMLEDTTREEREELGEVSEDSIVWQPFPNGHSIGTLLLHIADVELHWIQEVILKQPMSNEDSKLMLSEETQQGKVQWPVPPREPLQWYYDIHDRVRRRTREIVGGLGDPAEVIQHRGYPLTVRWILTHVIQHEAYHGGQAVLLALMRERMSG